jgi:hypothetical protein
VWSRMQRTAYAASPLVHDMAARGGEAGSLDGIHERENVIRIRHARPALLA